MTRWLPSLLLSSFSQSCFCSRSRRGTLWEVPKLSKAEWEFVKIQRLFVYFMMCSRLSSVVVVFVSYPRYVGPRCRIFAKTFLKTINSEAWNILRSSFSHIYSWCVCAHLYVFHPFTIYKMLWRFIFCNINKFTSFELTILRFVEFVCLSKAQFSSNQLQTHNNNNPSYKIITNSSIVQHAQIYNRNLRRVGRGTFSFSNNYFCKIEIFEN